VRWRPRGLGPHSNKAKLRQDPVPKPSLTPWETRAYALYKTRRTLEFRHRLSPVVIADTARMPVHLGAAITAEFH